MKSFDIFLEFAESLQQLNVSQRTDTQLCYPMHYHPQMELLYCQDGDFDLHLDKFTYKMEKGSLAIIFPVAVHSFSCADKCSCTFIHVPESIYLQIDNIFTLSSQHTGYLFDCTPSDELPRRQQLLQNICDYMSQGDSKIATYYTMILLTLCVRQIQSIAHQVVSFENNASALLRGVLSYIQNHYKEPITLDSLCAVFNTGKSTMSRMINTDLQSSLPELVNKYRMLEAGYLMTHTQMSITEISEEIGYSSPCNFNRNFQKHFGVSPREYRKQHKKTH